MFMKQVQRRRQDLRRRLPDSAVLKLGVLAARVLAHVVVFGSYGLAYAVAYTKEVSHADREGAGDKESGRGTQEAGPQGR